MKRFRVECPCCKGAKKLVVISSVQEVLPGVPIEGYVIDDADCSHCEGTGKIEAEVEEGTCPNIESDLPSKDQ